MSTVTGSRRELAWPRPLARFAAFLRRELAAFPGRGNVMMRCVLGSAIVIVTSMTLQVPELALSLIVVFFVTQSNVVLSRVIALNIVIGSTCAIASAIVVFMLTFDYPLLRIAVASAVFFCCTYLLRAVTKFGLVFFVTALIVIYAQSFADRTDNAEALVRACLWVWSAVNYPVAVALILNTILLPAEPERQLRAAMHRQLGAVQSRLAALVDPAEVPVALNTNDLQQGALSLQKLMRFSTMRKRYSGPAAAAMLACVTAVSRLYEAAAGLPVTAQPSTAAGIAAIRRVRGEVAALDAAISEGLPLPRAVAAGSEEEGPSIPAVAAMQRAIEALADAAASQESHASTPPPAAPAMLPADAFTNPLYARFALRTLLSVLICYVFYNAVNWPGIHTIMLTCLIVALPSLGASTRHGVLRISGALIASGLALFAVAFVIPHLESVTGLLLMSLPVIALGAWVSAGSERISYAGLQIMFTFSLALLEQFAPPSDLTEIRDRLVGILLGVGVATFMQMSLWPEGEADSLRLQLAKVLRAIAGVARNHAQVVESDAPAAESQSASTAWVMLADCEAMLARVALEPDWREGETARVTLLAQTVLAQSRSILLASDAFHIEANFDARRTNVSGAGLRQVCGALQRNLAESLERYAQQLSGEPPLAVPPLPLDLTRVAAAAAGEEGGAPANALLEWAARIDTALSGLPQWSTDELPLALPAVAGQG
jgi:multidrug resistance protein MdtO